MYITKARVYAKVSSNRDLSALLRAIREMAETRQSRVLNKRQKLATSGPFLERRPPRVCILQDGRRSWIRYGEKNMAKQRRCSLPQRLEGAGSRYGVCPCGVAQVEAGEIALDSPAAENPPRRVAEPRMGKAQRPRRAPPVLQVEWRFGRSQTTLDRCLIPCTFTASPCGFSKGRTAPRR